MNALATKPASTAGPRLFTTYTFVDYATQAYLLGVGLLILGFHGDAVEGWEFLVAGHVVAIGLLHGLIRTHAGGQTARVFNFLRHFYPVLLYTALYRETGHLNQMFVTGYLDPYFIRIEHTLFGSQPSLAFMHVLPYLVISELFYAAYFSFYLMITGVGLALFLRDRRQFFHYVSVVSFVLYVCYLIYIALPVVGPPLFADEHAGFSLPGQLEPGEIAAIPAAVQRGPFYQLMALLYDLFEAPGAAFPSSHVAVAITTLSFSFRYLPRIRIAHLITVVLLCLATVYCRYHYVVDVVAGLATAAILIPLGNWLYGRTEVRHPPR
jgi:membrane-associated phospholipid phosphatase